MGKEKPELSGPENGKLVNPCDEPQTKREEITSIVQIDDSELPQSIKDRFKD